MIVHHLTRTNTLKCLQTLTNTSTYICTRKHSYTHIRTRDSEDTHVQTHPYTSEDLTGGSPSTSVTVYTKHVHVMFNQQTVRVEFLLKTDSGYPKDTGVNKPWQPLGIPFATTPIGQLHQSPPSPIPGDRARGKWMVFFPSPARQRSRVRVPTDL